MKYLFAIMAVLMSTQIASAQTFMTSEELLSTIPGQTFYGISSKNTQWIQTYSAVKGRKKKGKIAGNSDGADYEAKWHVKDDQWCEDWGTGKACWSMERVDAKNFRIYIDGKPQKNFWTLR